MHEVQAHALKEGTRLGYTGEQLQSHVAAKVGQFSNSWIKYATDDREYGAAAPGKVMTDAGKTVIKEGKPFHMTTPDEQKARAESFNSEMKGKMQGK